ncbi:MAG: FecR domain-containing protein, partial [Terrimicrobiaceae bacterium]
MRHRIFGLFLCVANLVAVGAEPFERAEVTKAINAVSLLPRNTKAVPGDVVSGDSALKTGGNSRAELEFPDFTITRVGSNALFRFLAGRREITLDSGTLLFSSPKGVGGGKVQVGAITAAVTGTDFLISRIARRIKVICLTGKVLVYFTANPKLRVVLKPGQMVDIPAGATKMSPVVTINLGALISTSVLINMGPLRSQTTLERNASNQKSSLLARFFPGVNDLLTQTGTQPTQ